MMLAYCLVSLKKKTIFQWQEQVASYGEMSANIMLEDSHTNMRPDSLFSSAGAGIYCQVGGLQAAGRRGLACTLQPTQLTVHGLSGTTEQ